MVLQQRIFLALNLKGGAAYEFRKTKRKFQGP